jgi:hypothetical protein
MSLVTKIQELAGAIGTDVKTINTSIGTLASLTTTTKVSLVLAVNEVVGDLGALETALGDLETAAATIDDGTPSHTSVWSSTKTSTEIATSISNLLAEEVTPIASDLADHIGSTNEHPNATTSLSGFMSGADKTKLNGIETGATADLSAGEVKTLYESNANTNAFTDTYKGLVDTALKSADLSGYALESYVDSEIASLLDSAPGTLDTLNELAAALGDDPNFASTTATALGNRLRVDAAQTFTAPEKLQAQTNLDVYSKAEIGNPETNLASSYTAARDL